MHGRGVGLSHRWAASSSAAGAVTWPTRSSRTCSALQPERSPRRLNSRLRLTRIRIFFPDFRHFRASPAATAAAMPDAVNRSRVMKGNPRVIELLNEALQGRVDRDQPILAALSPARQLGRQETRRYERHELIDEMKHADKFADRILFLDGFPNFQSLNPLAHRRERRGNPQADLAAEHEAVEMYRNGVAECEALKDYVSRDLFAEVLQGRGRTCRLHRDPVRPDPPDGHPELRPAAERGRRRLARADTIAPLFIVLGHPSAGGHDDRHTARATAS